MKILLPLLVILVLASVYLGYKQIVQTPKKGSATIKSITNTTPSPSNRELKTFQSKIMKFTIALPDKLSAIDESSRVKIQSSKGEIFVNRNGTQFNDLDTYLSNFDQTTQLDISLDENMIINNNVARKRISKNPNIGIEKTYFIYAENYVYKISTSSEDLYIDLDQIAQSFRYTP
ncbi:MAG: hypothetical protein UT84_C0001G0069 [Candidatus Curtissbacteria bacterium GW2011_GWA1_40_16]|uniref:Uncharacterized protein n=1 Tax=Candidatus Curtissbacteria bacterium GW2011_GWA1_40_16 TaxID=1618405 RepID=A0A0G0RF90_9BACT|nr:MAG: hypothetical protein UT84_C0001G0069 [Candidatus Curtissbacteria bacterium GW2011_GWA1_40_16]